MPLSPTKHLRVDSIEGLWTPSRPRNPPNGAKRRCQGDHPPYRKAARASNTKDDSKKDTASGAASEAKQSVELSTPSRLLGKRAAKRDRPQPPTGRRRDRIRMGCFTCRQPTVLYLRPLQARPTLGEAANWRQAPNPSRQSFTLPGQARSTTGPLLSILSPNHTTDSSPSTTPRRCAFPRACGL